MPCCMVQKILQFNEICFISCDCAAVHYYTVTIHPVRAYPLHPTAAANLPHTSLLRAINNKHVCRHSKLTFSLRLVCMNSGNPRSWAPTSVSSLGGLKPTIPTLYSRQYLSSSSRFHLSICRYLLRFSNTITPYFPLSRFVSTGSDLPDTSTLYLTTHKSQLQISKSNCEVIKDSRLLRCDTALLGTRSFLQSFKIQRTKSAPYYVSKIPCCLC